jgi:flagellar biogenesis protein FliO
MSLTPQHSLHLVRVEDRTMLIAASPSGCSILEGFAEPAREKVEIR